MHSITDALAPRNQDNLEQYLISLLQNTLGTDHALYRRDDMLAYVPITQLCLGILKLGKIWGNYSIEIKLACVDSLLASKEIAHLRAHTIHYLQQSEVISEATETLSYLSKLSSLPSPNERMFDHIFVKLNSFECRSQYWVDRVLSHPAPDKLFLGLEILSKHYSLSKDNLRLIPDYLELLFNEPISPEIIANIIVRIDANALSIQNVLEELECSVIHENQQLQAYQSLWSTLKTEAERDHNQFLDKLKNPAFLLILRDQAIDDYMDFQDYLDKIAGLELLEGEEHEACLQKLKPLKDHAHKECGEYWEKLENSEYLNQRENTLFEERMMQLESREKGSLEASSVRIADLIRLTKHWRQKVPAVLPKDKPLSSPLITYSTWQSRSIEIKTDDRDESWSIKPHT